MRYTLAAFAIMASAVLASPVPLDTKTNEIAVRDTANTDVMNWGPFGGPPGFSSYTDWSTHGVRESMGWSFTKKALILTVAGLCDMEAMGASESPMAGL